MRYIVLHHIGADYEGDAVEAAWATDRYHREDKGWSGIGYHLVAVDGMVVLGGDLATARANVAGRNHEVIGILWPRNGNVRVPEVSDLVALKQAIAYATAACPQAIVVGHREISIPGYSTECPGQTFASWKGQVL